MNPPILEWVKSLAAELAGDVLDVGSLNVNGQVRDVIPVSVGVDLRNGPGVDVVMDASRDLVATFGKERFDAVTCCEMLEHCEDWRGAVHGMWDVLKPGGKLLITVPTIRKGYHGYPADYWRWNATTVREVWPGTEVRETWASGIGWIVQKNGDLPDLKWVELTPVAKPGKKKK